MRPPDGSSEFLAFHGDELVAQALAGQGPKVARMRPFMPDQHREFFAGLPYLFVATADAAGWPVASVLSGQPGFVRSPDPVTLRIDGVRNAEGLAAGRDVGLLGLDLANRRRNRANGHLTEVDEGGLTVRINQSFGNCAQYIQTRQPTAVLRTPQPVERFDRLDDAARTLIAAADTFFVASRSRPEAGAAGGFDMSHRGGRPGFVGIDGDTLAIPDFRGNRFYNTLGNLLGEPRTGLLFLDFTTGDLLQLQGRAEIDWAPDDAGPESSRPAGAERLWRVKVERGWRRRGTFPFAWTFGDYAPTTLKTGAW